MNWTLLWISTAIWIFFGAHFIFYARLSALSELGMPVSKTFMVASKLMAMLAMFNLLAFFVAYAAMVNIMWAVAIVAGGYISSLLYVAVVRDTLLTPTHKLGWLAIPVLSIAVWMVAFWPSQ